MNDTDAMAALAIRRTVQQLWLTCRSLRDMLYFFCRRQAAFTCTLSSKKPDFGRIRVDPEKKTAQLWRLCAINCPALADRLLGMALVPL